MGGGWLPGWVGGSSGIIVCLSGGDPVIRLTVMSVTVSQQSQYIVTDNDNSHNIWSQSVKVSHNSHKIYSQ